MKMSQAPAIERDERERTGINPIQTADVDRDRFSATLFLPARERTDPALSTEQMVDDFLVELIIGQFVGPCAQRKLLGRDEDPQRAALGADRAIACKDLREIRGYVIAHLAAMTAARAILAF